MRLIDEIFENLTTWGNQPVLVERGRDGKEVSVSSPMFRACIEEFSRLFSEAGVSSGTLVILFVDNCWVFPAIFLGLLQNGAIPVLAKKAFRKMELDQVFNTCDPEVIICDEDFREQISLYMAGRMVITRKNETLVVSGTKGNRGTRTVPGTISVNYTYRGFGYPIGAMVGESGYREGAKRYQHYVQFQSHGKALALLPMSNIFTMISSVILPLQNKITIYILNSPYPKDILKCLEESEINYLSTIPEVLLLLARLKSDHAIYPALKVLVSGGSYLSDSNHRYISERFGVEVLNGYGLTEIAPVTANSRNFGKIGSLGEFCKGLECRIAGSADSQNGEIEVRTSDSFLGYIGMPDESADVIHDGWFKTGDLGRLVDGKVLFKGELKRTRKVNGQIVDLKEVEKAILNTGKVRRTTVSGETNHIHADLVLVGNGENREEKDILRDIRGIMGLLIASYKIPKSFTITGRE